MTSEERERPDRQVRLDRDVILEAAKAIVAAEGLPALTMRRIGTELGADPTAVYRHFRDKQELLTALADRMFATYPDDPPETPWQDRLRTVMWLGLDLYRDDVELGMLLAGQHDDLPSLLKQRSILLQILTDAGLSLSTAALMSHVVENHMVGSGLFFAVCKWEECPPETNLEAMRRAYAALPDDSPPLIREAAPDLFPEPDEAYALACDLLIDSIQRIAAGEREAVTVR